MAEHPMNERAPGGGELSDDRIERILALLEDNRACDEPYHERDCPACDLADEIVGSIGADWDPNMTWADVPAIGWDNGDSMERQAVRIVAHVLHRRLPGHSGGGRRG